MNIYLRDINKKVFFALAEVFKETGVEVSLGGIFDIPAEAIVSPANSFGYMDGGIDNLYRHHFGFWIEQELMQRIAFLPDKHLPVGEAVITRTKNERHPFMISAPTMYLPQRVETTRNAELAFGAALKIAKQHNMKSIISPGLCTLTGAMEPEVAAEQMYQAWVKHG
jgi:O-acetyl-ADP-ribose deacetylase (regulator of RNase III)